MGEAKRRKMSSEKKTFQNANPVSRAAYETQVHRLHILSELYKAQAPEMIADEVNWVGRTLIRAEVVALVNILANKGILTHEEFLDAARDEVEKVLDAEQKRHKIIITTGEIIQGDKHQPITIDRRKHGG